MPTRIGLASLLRSRQGSIVLPEEIVLACPRCAERATDRGQCIVEIAMVSDATSKTFFRAKLRVDCRACGCSEEEPAVIVEV